jgi:hypothetical protein
MTSEYISGSRMFFPAAGHDFELGYLVNTDDKGQFQEAVHPTPTCHLGRILAFRTCKPWANSASPSCIKQVQMCHRVLVISCMKNTTLTRRTSREVSGLWASGLPEVRRSNYTLAGCVLAGRIGEASTAFNH